LGNSPGLRGHEPGPGGDPCLGGGRRDLAQAADDLRRDWSARRTPTSALDAGLPAVPIKEAVVSLATADHAGTRRRWQDHVAPEASRLDAAIGLGQDEVARLTASVERQAARSASITDGRRVMEGIVAIMARTCKQFPNLHSVSCHR
jgi:hypothetical protein